MNELERLRREYDAHGLDLGDLDPSPIVQFTHWFDEVRAAGHVDPHAMVLSTVGPDGWPAGRSVLCRGVDERGFTFYTNYRSAKARDLDASGRAALTFTWLEVRRQVRVVGTVGRIDAAESDRYFAGRPRGGQIGAWASNQSEVVPDRATLDERYAEVDRRYGDGEVPRPPHWGGYRVAPLAVEFWQGRDNRLHDRMRYVREGEGWRIERVAP